MKTDMNMDGKSIHLTSTIEHLFSDVWYFGMPVPKEIGEQIIDGNHRRVICNVNNQHSFHCALMPDGQGGYFININKEIRKKLGLNEGDKVNLILEKDTSEYGMPMPEEFAEVLSQDEEANRFFHELTIGKQRNLIYIAGKLKSSQKRLEKSIIILEYLKSVKGKLDFKELNEAFKNSRFK